MSEVTEFIDKVLDDAGVKESDQTDPLTLVNLIIHKDARNQGYDWGSPVNKKTPAEILHTPMPMQGPGTFVTEAMKETQKELDEDSKKK
jgi:hypothetical protein